MLKGDVTPGWWNLSEDEDVILRLSWTTKGPEISINDRIFDGRSKPLICANFHV
jgi:hypothetical protein